MITDLTELREILRSARPADDVEFEGGGTIERQEFVGCKLRSLTLFRRHWLDRVLDFRSIRLGGARWSYQPLTFRNCTFVDLEIAHFNPGVSWFVGCSFVDVRVDCDPGLINANFTDCTFSGTWSAIVAGRHYPGEPRARAVVKNNDFSCVEGVEFYGVREDQQVFDTSRGRQFVLRRRDANNWDLATRLSSQDQRLENIVRGIDRRQTWQLVTRSSVEPPTWDRLTSEAAWF